MTYADNYNIRTTSVKFNDVGDALDGLITRNYAGLTTGTSTAYIATPSPSWDAYTTSGLVVIIPHVTNTGGSTINIAGLGLRDLRIGNIAIAAGVLQQNIPTIMAYTGTYFEVLLQSVSIPIGAIYTYAGASAPGGYLLCDGGSNSTTGAYAALFGVIGYTFGGSGGTFLLPDFRRRMPIGKGASDTLGFVEGNINNTGTAYASRTTAHTHTTPAHEHSVAVPNHQHTVPVHSHAVSGTLSVDIAHSHSNASFTGSIGGSDGTHTHGVSLNARSASGNTAAENFLSSFIPASATSSYLFTNGSATSSGSGHGHSHTLATSLASSPTNATGTLTAGSGVSGAATFQTTPAEGGATVATTGGAAGTSGTGNSPFLFINYIIKT